MRFEMLKQSWESLRRNPLRSFLTMLGIAWGVVTVTLLIAYGGGFRRVLVDSFEAFGKTAIVCWPGQTSEQAGGQRAGRRIRLERVDLENVLAESTAIQHASLETVQWRPVTYGDRLSNSPVRGVYPIYGEIRNQKPSEGRWISPEDLQERRRVIFLGGDLRKNLFSNRPALGETVRISGMRFTVIGVMDRKLQLSNYFGSDDNSAFIPYTTAGDLWNNRYASVLVFAPISPDFDMQARKQAVAALAKRQHFSPTDRRAAIMNSRTEFRVVVDAITIGLQVLLALIGALTLGIGGVGVMNIMLVTVDERVREIGLRRALGARQRHIRAQFLCEALVITLAGGVAGLALSYLIAQAVGTLPMMGVIFEDTSGRRDIQLVISPWIAAVSTAILVVVGVLSGLVPALRASRLDPAAALRNE
jgi:putative ABC transport system permease protein